MTSVCRSPHEDYKKETLFCTRRNVYNILLIIKNTRLQNGMVAILWSNIHTQNKLAAEN